MGRYVSWAHGNALTVESPENLQAGGNHFGWGADIVILPGRGSWFHVPLPVPAMVNDSPVYLRRTYLLFKTENALLKHVHIYDGALRLQAFDNIQLGAGDFTTLIVDANTFVLSTLHRVRRGISLSFFIQGGLTGTEAGDNLLVVTSVGAEYIVVGGQSVVLDVARLIDRVLGH